MHVGAAVGVGAVTGAGAAVGDGAVTGVGAAVGDGAVTGAGAGACAGVVGVGVCDGIVASADAYTKRVVGLLLTRFLAKSLEVGHRSRSLSVNVLVGACPCGGHRQTSVKLSWQIRQYIISKFRDANSLTKPNLTLSNLT